MPNPSRSCTIGRAYCAACHRVIHYVASVGVLELRCPTCDGLTVPAHQDDTEERR